jgi:CP family cyanate transporter-like MFS transporter
MNPSASSGAGSASPNLITALGLLWLAGMAARVTILAVPPVIPLIHDDLRMTETQVGLLIGLPLVTFALASIPGSLLIARLGAYLTMTVGMLITAIAAAARGGASNLMMLYLATTIMGFGVALMQPALPTLVRQWAPHRTGLATAISTNGMMVAIAGTSALTIPFVLPLVGGSWRLEFVLWAAPALATALLYLALASRWQSRLPQASAKAPRRWLPDWKNPLIWLLGFTFGSNNASYYSVNAFVPDYLASIGRADLIAATLGWLNTCQLLASLLLLVTAERLQRRAWPYLVFGPLLIVGVAGVVFGSGIWTVAAAGLVGFSLAITFVVTMALPPVLSPPDDIHRTAGGMFTISYTIAVIVPILCGALWDLTGIPWLTFLPVAVCALVLTTLGFLLSLRKPVA